MKKKKLGVLLSTAPSHPNIRTVTALCGTALAADIDVYLYLIDEGVENVRDERFLGLSAQGVKFFVCAYGCQQHHVETGNLGPAVTLCGLVVLSNIINGCDRFVAFN
jgi:sulfur relay (sulfurtransferase) complex TusBCD TusD component (DsrE family)